MLIDEKNDVHSIGEGLICHARYGDLNLMVFGRRPWTDAQFRESCVEMHELTKKRGAARFSLGFSTSQNVTAGQRRITTEFTDPALRIRVAVLTQSGLARTTINALGLVLSQFSDFHAFPPLNGHAALQWLDPRFVKDADKIAERLRYCLVAAGYQGNEAGFAAPKS